MKETFKHQLSVIIKDDTHFDYYVESIVAKMKTAEAAEIVNSYINALNDLLAENLDADAHARLEKLKANF